MLGCAAGSFNGCAHHSGRSYLSKALCPGRFSARPDISLYFGMALRERDLATRSKGTAPGVGLSLCPCCESGTSSRALSDEACFTT